MPATLVLKQIKGTLVDADAGDFKIQSFGVDSATGVPFSIEHSYNTADDFVTVFNADSPVFDATLDI